MKSGASCVLTLFSAQPLRLEGLSDLTVGIHRDPLTAEARRRRGYERFEALTLMMVLAIDYSFALRTRRQKQEQHHHCQR